MTALGSENLTVVKPITFTAAVGAQSGSSDQLINHWSGGSINVEHTKAEMGRKGCL